MAHGPHPRSYAKRVPQKVARLAFRCAFSDLVREGRVRVLEQLNVAEPKTKGAIALLNALGLDKGALIVVSKLDKNLICAVRNLQNVEATTVQSVNTYQLLRYPTTVITREAMDGLYARLSGETGRET